MSIQYTPNPGSILRCDFHGLKEPEMIKPRPVVVISTRPERSNKRTCIIVPLSTTEPTQIHKFHLKIQLPGLLLPRDIARECWVKGDMIYTVSIERLDLYKLGRNDQGKREYYYDRIDNNMLFGIRKAVCHAIGVHL